ncbi:MAG: 2-C-methyl-D-erythritol 4-phosphate cytidylyltransferase [Candidatus Omnitrophica bacterium]|jgi:2-C-methyl-D-erythritol 4-phosphate cytidylyltransferase|nr:2-C-methyl-D-erythritol 4-phosphate cytidylyltransferase [Candidatus Omnitrophota bacterium]
MVTAIVVAAGKGKRLKSRVAKPLIKLSGKPLLAYSLEVFNRHPCIDEIIVVVNKRICQEVFKIIRRYRIDKAGKIVLGGLRRQDSVACGLSQVSNCSEIVLIHDAGRPFVTGEIISRVLKEVSKSGAAVAGVPVKATIKQVKRKKEKGEIISKNPKVQNQILVEKTLDRKLIWEAQTPQGFKKDIILSAYKKYGKFDVTDDAMLVEKTGHKVSMVLGAYSNIKVTTAEDLVITGEIIKRKD